MLKDKIKFYLTDIYRTVKILLLRFKFNNILIRCNQKYNIYFSDENYIPSIDSAGKYKLIEWRMERLDYQDNIELHLTLIQEGD